ncbi:MAG: DNA primase [Phycisphaerae bacterium]
MPLFSEQFIQQVAQATDIVELVGQYVALKRKGKEFVGLCPFHDDRSPSMYVTPVKQIYKCFACGAGGGVYQFVMNYEKLSFPEAVRMLAERASIPIPQDAQAQPTAPGQLPRAELIKVCEFAANYFQRQLKSPIGNNALAYARSRGLDDAAIEKFGIGYAPESWEGLIRAAQQAGVHTNALLQAGLVINRDNKPGCYDRFRNRLMFPIFDAMGRNIAFGGRALSADDKAKYLNSPETAIFDKSGNLYGLNWARHEIAQSGKAVVAEGYFDVVMPHQAGVGNLVATLGTALTDRHVRLLSRYAEEVTLIFDADEAGIRAAERALEVFIAQRIQVKVATIAAGKDPCDYVLSEGPEALKALIDSAPDALEYVWKRKQEQLRQAGDNLAGRRQIVEDFLRLVVSSEAYGSIDQMRRGQLAQHIAHLLNVSPADLQQMMRQLSRRTTTRSRVSPDQQQIANARPQGWRPDNTTYLAERHILEVLLNREGLYETAAERVGPEDFTDPALRLIAQCIWRLGDDGRFSLDELLASSEMASLGGLISDLATEGEKRGNFDQTLAGGLAHLGYLNEKRTPGGGSGNSLDDEALRRIHESKANPDVRRLPKIR